MTNGELDRQFALVSNRGRAGKNCSFGGAEGQRLAESMS